MTRPQHADSEEPQDTHFVLLPTTDWARPRAYRVGGPDLNLMDGTLVDPPASPFQFELRADSEARDPAGWPLLDLYDEGHGRLLVSPGLVLALQEIGVDNVQLFSCETTCALTRARVEYHVANIVGLIKAVDLAKSTCDVDENGAVETVYRFRFDCPRISTFDIFRMWEARSIIVVSRRVKETLQVRGSTGMRFLRDVEWEPGLI